ncbi:hypothetical protein R9U70_02355, partial [Escherichia coli]
SIKNDGHYFCRAGGNRPDGLNEPVTLMWVNSCQIIFERRLQKCDVLMNSAIPASRSRFF